MDTGDYMTIEEAMERLNVARASVYHAAKTGHIRMETVLGRRVVVRADVEAYRPRPYTGKREGERPEGVKGPGGRPRKAAQSESNGGKQS